MRRSLLACACLLLDMVGPCEASEAIAGAWQGQSGPEDNRATFGLEITQIENGGLSAHLSIDLLGVYGQAIGPMQRLAARHYTVPAADIDLTLGDNEVQVSGLLADPKAGVTLRRAAHALTPPPRPSFPAGPEPQWTTRLGGAVFAPVAVYDGAAFVGNTDGVFSAITIARGRKLWSFAAGRPIFGEALATDDAVYFVCDNGYLYRLNRITGKELWRYDLGDARVQRVLPNPFIFDYDYRAPRPTLANGVLFVGSGDGSFHAVNAATGKRVWRIAGSKAIRGTAVVMGSRVIYSSNAGLVHAVERSTGSSVWQFDAKSPVTAPALVAGRIIVGTRDSRLYALDAANGDVLWSQYWWGSWVESTAVDWQGHAYVGSGDLARVSCIDPERGQNLWRTAVGGWVLQRPLVTDRTIYVGVSGARRAASFWPPQASALVALDRTTGQAIWQWSMPELAGAFMHGFVAAPVTAGSNLLIGGVDGTLYAFKVD
jgi:eukaryotic-like serine/threonine-protein kinase